MKSKWILSLLVLIIVPMFGAFVIADEDIHLLLVRDGDICFANDEIWECLIDGEPLDNITPNSDVPSYHMPLVLLDREMIFFAQWFSNDLLWAPLDGSGMIQSFYDVEFFTPFGMTVSPDGNALGIVVLRENKTFFEAISLNDGDVLHSIEVPFAGGCGGGPYLPDTLVYNRQAGLNGNGLLLEWTEQGVLLSMSCTGEGVQEIDLETEQWAIINAELRRVQLSPNGDRLIGLFAGNLLIVDRFTGDARLAHMDLDGYDQVIWTPEGNIIFTTVEQRGIKPLVPKYPDLAAEVLFGQESSPIPLYRMNLYEWQIESDETQLLWTSDDWRGAPLMVVDENMLYFSAVEDMTAMINALNQGKSREDVLAAWPESHVLRLSLEENSTPEIFIVGGEAPVVVQ